MATPDIPLNVLYDDWQIFAPVEFNKHLKDSWVLTEFPNMESTRILNYLFNKSQKELLMNKEELKVFNKLPNKIKVFRGLNDSKTKKKGLSWTLNKATAEWFANRWDRKGKVLTAVISKQDVFAVFLDRQEEEIVLNPNKLREISQ